MLDTQKGRLVVVDCSIKCEMTIEAAQVVVHLKQLLK